MSTPEAGTDAARSGTARPRRRTDVVVVTVCAIAVALTMIPLAGDPAEPDGAARIVGLLVGLILAAALWWRHSHPTAVVIAAVVTSPFAPTLIPGLVALYCYGRRRPGWVWAAAAASVVLPLAIDLALVGWSTTVATNLGVGAVLVASVVAAAVSPGREGPRSAIEWLTDLTVYVAAWFVNVVVLMIGIDESAIEPTHAVGRDLALVAALTVALWFRRQWPVPLAVACVAVAPFALFGIGTFLVATFAVAAHRRTWTALAVVAGHVGAATLHTVIAPATDMRPAAAAVIATLAYGGVTGWGILARSRRELVGSLRERARQAEAEQELRMERARRLERERIAREMHDVLAHRLSLLSVHAGALEYRPDAPAAEVGAAASVIRDSAHRALEDLREVIGVLRGGPEEETPDRPQPTLADLDALIREARQVGVTITADTAVAGAAVPDRIGRTAYRVVQEALTNARKHAPAAPVSLRLSGTAGDALTVEVANPLTATGSTGPAGSTSIPGASSGLVGLGERVGLAGGTFTARIGSDGRFTVRARLPWPL